MSHDLHAAHIAACPLFGMLWPSRFFVGALQEGGRDGIGTP
jgi:hypothetical protein